MGEIAQVSSKPDFLEGLICCSSWKDLVANAALAASLRVFFFYSGCRMTKLINLNEGTTLQSSSL
jgi:hypothetical protein